MGRISIDVSDEEHKRLKALAALKGVSLKDFLLGSALQTTTDSEEEALGELESILLARIQRAEQGGVSTETVDGIFESVRLKKGIAPSNG